MAMRCWAHKAINFHKIQPKKIIQFLAGMTPSYFPNKYNGTPQGEISIFASVSVLKPKRNRTAY